MTDSDRGASMAFAPDARHVVVFGLGLALALGWLIEASRGATEVDLPTAEALAEPAWAEREVHFASGEVEIAGTLTLPSGAGPFPAAIHLSGAGVQDRDGSAANPDESRRTVEAFARARIALLRTDDRGAGESTGDSFQATFDDLVDDAAAAVAFLAQDAAINPRHIGLIGASQGAAIAGLTASRHDGIAFVVFYSGLGLPGKEVLYDQLARMHRAGGLPEATIEQALELTREGVGWLEAPIDDATRRDKLRPLARRLRELTRTNPFAARDSAASIEREVEHLTSPAFRSALDYDPRPALRGLRCPVLVIHGELDLQVDPDLNLPPVEEALAAAPTEDVTVVRFAGLNHYLQPAETGHLSEYGRHPRSPEVIERTTAWIAERFVGREGAP
ncbi:MAG: alpha/beta hydrolase [Acidobacteriota bacterium]